MSCRFCKKFSWSSLISTGLLGHLLAFDGKMEHDARKKLAQYIDGSVKMRENFYFAHPLEQISAIDKYCSSVYGSVLLDLRGDAASSIYSAWKTGVKLSWGISRSCHMYLLQNVLAPGSVSLRVRLLTQSLGFFHGLLSSPSKEAAVAARLSARDLRTNLCSNLALIREETGLDPWEMDKTTVQTALQSAEWREISLGDEWRCEYLWKLLNQKLQYHYDGRVDDENFTLILINSLEVN